MFFLPNRVEVLRGGSFIQIAEDLLISQNAPIHTERWISSSFFFSTISGILFLNSNISEKLLFPSRGLVSESSNH